MKYVAMTSLALILCVPSAVGMAADGQALYRSSCIACHGDRGQGALPGVPNLLKSGRLSKTDAELIDSIMKGMQTKGSPMAMPAKGGNAKLTEVDAQALVRYLRSLQGTPKR
ncbi:MAG: c-type cytochrome [Pseudomonadota bacterium]